MCVFNLQNLLEQKGNIFSLSGLNVIDIIDLIPCNKLIDTSFGEIYDMHLGASLVAQMVKSLPAVWETQV